MKEKSKKKIDLIIKIVLIIIIILLLITNCTLLKKIKEIKKLPGGNVDIIEITCEDNVCKPIPKQIESLGFVQKKVYVKKDNAIKLIVNINPVELSSSKLTWKSSDPNIVTVDSDGVVRGINIGKATITVTSSNGKTATCIVEVTKDNVNVKKIKLTPTKAIIEVGTLTQIKTVIEPENATNRDLIWESSDSNIAIVDSNGVVKGISVGTVTITAKTKDGKVIATTTISVNPKTTTKQIESLTFAQDKVGVKKGETSELIVIVDPSELSSSKLTWKSSDSNIVTVDANGIVKGISVGKATITVTSSNGKTATCTVEVTTNTIEVEKIILTPNEQEIEIESTTQIKAEIKPENATNHDLIWESSDPNIATVDNKGVVKGIADGIVTIIAKTKDGKVVATTTITIKQKVYDEELSIFDNDHTALNWNGSSDLKIFSKTAYTMDGKIAPESSNMYQFTVKNSTKYNIKYQIKFIETNESNINMQYKLKKNDTYIIDHYVRPDELTVYDMSLNSGKNDTYYLEWKWISSSNDTAIGKSPEAKYGLKIEIDAEGTND